MLPGGLLAASFALGAMAATDASHSYTASLASSTQPSRIARIPVHHARRQSHPLFAKMSSVASPVPPVAAHDFASYTPDGIKAIIEKAIARNRELEDQVVTLKPEECTFDTVAKPLAWDDSAFSTDCDSAVFMSSVSTDKAIRDAASDANKQWSEYAVESGSRQDTFEAYKNVNNNTPTGSLDPESQRLLVKALETRRRLGLDLTADQQKRFKELRQEIDNICIEFTKNYDEEAGFLLFTRDELDGVPESVISGYPEVDDNGVKKLKVTHKTPDLTPLLQYANNPDTRYRAWFSNENRVKENNSPLFKEIVDLRNKAAEVIGYKSWADYAIEPKMAKTAQTAIDFLDDLYTKIKPIGEKERANLLKLKEERYKELNLPFDGKYNVWDYRYLDRLYIEKTLTLDNEAVKEYLPVETVLNTMMDLYQNLLGVKCFITKDAPTWHEDVTVFTVWDSASLDSQKPAEEAFLGWLYLDLYPRDNKYGHAAVWPLQPGYILGNGTRQHGYAAMVANVAKPTNDKPALMSHEDFVTLFHELGHAWHDLLSKVTYGQFYGTSVAWDFVEAPSQMLENWCFEPKVLKLVSSHYKTKEPMPDDMIEKIIKSQNMNQGLYNLRQIAFGKFDLQVHIAKESINYTEVWNKDFEEISLVEMGDAPVDGFSAFQHLVGGYDAGYYGYLYSQSFSVDMYETVFRKDPLSPELGMHYRTEILQPGSSRDEMESLSKFLGRPPSNEAFMKKLLAGLNDTSV